MGESPGKAQPFRTSGGKAALRGSQTFSSSPFGEEIKLKAYRALHWNWPVPVVLVALKREILLCEPFTYQLRLSESVFENPVNGDAGPASRRKVEATAAKRLTTEKSLLPVDAGARR